MFIASLQSILSRVDIPLIIEVALGCQIRHFEKVSASPNEIFMLHNF